MKKLGKKIIKWIVNTKKSSFLNKYLMMFTAYVVKSQKAVIIPYGGLERKKIFDLIEKIKKETKMLLNDYEAYLIFITVKKLEKIEGDIAEVGVYKGGSAKLICEAKNDKKLHLFDTFEGLPNVNALLDTEFFNGQHAAKLEEVKIFLGGCKNVYFYKGVFPGTAEPIEGNKFSFVHLDVDTHESTINCLKFFYTRMNRGGIIISHDYDSIGIKKAFDEFFSDKPDIVIELIGTQCLVVKI